MSANCVQKLTIVTPHGKSVETDCGRCWVCRDAKINDFVGRCLMEQEMAVQSVFATLTYADHTENGATEVIPEGERCYNDVIRFLKRLRNDGHLIRYVAASEIGEEKGRYHFHVLLFFHTKIDLPTVRERENWKYWPHGFTNFREVDMRNIAYVVKYIGKAELPDDDPNPEKRGLNPLASGRHRLRGKKEYKITYSTRPSLGWGPSYYRGERPMEIVQRRLVERGLPFSREYKHPKGYWVTPLEGKTIMKSYFMNTNRMVELAYAAYCKYYYAKHRKGDPPVKADKDEWGNADEGRRTVLKICYGELAKERPLKADLVTVAERRWAWPLPYAKDRTVKNIKAFVKRRKAVGKEPGKAAYYVHVLHDGRVLLGVMRTQLYDSYHRRVTRDPVLERRLRYSENQLQSVGLPVPTHKVMTIWPAKDRAEIRRFLREVGYRYEPPNDAKSDAWRTLII